MTLDWMLTLSVHRIAGHMEHVRTDDYFLKYTLSLLRMPKRTAARAYFTRTSDRTSRRVHLLIHRTQRDGVGESPRRRPAAGSRVGVARQRDDPTGPRGAPHPPDRLCPPLTVIARDTPG